MHPDMERVMALQVLDLEAKKLRDEIAALPKHVAGLETKAKTTAAQRGVVLDLIAKEDALRRRLESDIKDQQAKLARGKQKIDMATSTAQVTALEHEMTYAQKEILRLEDEELESMMRSEGLDAQKKVADQALTAAESTHQSERERAIEVIDRNNGTIVELDARRKAQRVDDWRDGAEPLRPDREVEGHGDRRGAGPKMHGVPDDAPAAALERSPRARQLTR